MVSKLVFPIQVDKTSSTMAFEISCLQSQPIRTGWTSS